MPSCLTTCTGGERDDDDRGATTKGRRMLETQTWNQCEARARIIHRTRLSGQITFDLIRCFVTRWKMWTCLPRQVGCVSERTAALSLLAALGFHARIAGLEGPEHPRNEHFSFATASKLIKAKLQLWKKKKIPHEQLRQPNFSTARGRTRRVRPPQWQVEHFWFSANGVRNLKKIR